jgi:DASH complex subunit DAD4
MLSVTPTDSNTKVASPLTVPKEKLNEAIMMLNKNLQEINIQNMDTELVAQMFKNYQSNVLFHLEGTYIFGFELCMAIINKRQPQMVSKTRHEH